ncbi:MAG: hypothetical protein D6B25_20555 [Desulfobulbaceae bacterium]|nr:MAG: hypothetical protein D6B25_20555 [Desulfobulbaceae bacterium]
MNVRIYALLIAFMMLLPACSDPYFTMTGDAKMMIERDIRFLEMYEKSLCEIKKGREREELSRGKCLALYYDLKENERVENSREKVAKRVSYIVTNPDKFEKDDSIKVYNLTTKIGECDTYILQNCM